MDDLSMTARVVEEVVRRVFRRYQEHMMADDYHRRCIDVALEDLPSLVIGALREVREKTADPDAPSPYDLSSWPRPTRRRGSGSGAGGPY